MSQVTFRTHTLPNGLQLVAECNPNAYSTGLSYFVKEMHVESGTLITFSKQNKKLDVIQEYSIKKVFL